ncbi:hypothetical protein KY331_00745 [Candidatus Woesearchaeota archaeon]|nr:hypothetical protein [Candidatus Woesearchaeota archaeon]
MGDEDTQEEKDERTIIIIKPEGLSKDWKVLGRDVFTYALGRLDAIDDIEVTHARTLIADRDRIANTYIQHKEKPFYELFFPYFVGNQIHVAIYEGKGVIKKVMAECGNKDPALARREWLGVLRPEYGEIDAEKALTDPELMQRFPPPLRALSNDSLEAAIKEERMVRNLIHRADSEGAAERTIGIWYPELARFFQ